MSDEANGDETSQDTPPQLGRTAKVILPLAILLVLLGVAELLLRFAAPLPYSSRLWWVADGHVKGRLEPGQDPVNTDGNVVQINELGFRGPLPSWQPAAGTLRVVTLGGSSTFCYDASDDAHTWPALLEGKLHKALGMPVEVINLGLPGYDTSNSKVNYLFTGRALAPHVVTVYHAWNDFKFLRLIDRSDGPPRWVLSGRDAIGSNLSWLEHLYWSSQIVQRVSLIARENRLASQENLYTSMEKEGSTAHAPVGEKGWAWFDGNFRDVARFVRADGALPVLISQATLAHPDNLDKEAERVAVRNHLLGMTLPRLVETWQEANARLERIAREEGAVYVDGYAGVPPVLDNLKDHVHLLDPGNERLAQVLTEGLMADPRFIELARRVRRGEPLQPAHAEIAPAAPVAPETDTPASVAAAPPDAGAAP